MTEASSQPVPENTSSERPLDDQNSSAKQKESDALKAAPSATSSDNGQPASSGQPTAEAGGPQGAGAPSGNKNGNANDPHGMKSQNDGGVNSNNNDSDVGTSNGKSDDNVTVQDSLLTEQPVPGEPKAFHNVENGLPESFVIGGDLPKEDPEMLKEMENEEEDENEEKPPPLPMTPFSILHVVPNPFRSVFLISSTDDGEYPEPAMLHNCEEMAFMHAHFTGNFVARAWPQGIPSHVSDLLKEAGGRKLDEYYYEPDMREDWMPEEGENSPLGHYSGAPLGRNDIAAPKAVRKVWQNRPSAVLRRQIQELERRGFRDMGYASMETAIGHFEKAFERRLFLANKAAAAAKKRMKRNASTGTSPAASPITSPTAGNAEQKGKDSAALRNLTALLLGLYNHTALSMLFLEDTTEDSYRFLTRAKGVVENPLPLFHSKSDRFIARVEIERNLSYLYLNRGNPHTCLNLLEHLLKEQRAHPKANKLHMIPTLNNLGALYSQYGKHSDAKSLFKEALTLVAEAFEGYQNGVPWAILTCNQATELFYLEKYKAAIDTYSKALERSSIAVTEEHELSLNIMQKLEGCESIALNAPPRFTSGPKILLADHYLGFGYSRHSIVHTPSRDRREIEDAYHRRHRETLPDFSFKPTEKVVRGGQAQSLIPGVPPRPGTAFNPDFPPRSPTRPSSRASPKASRSPSRQQQSRGSNLGAESLRRSGSADTPLREEF